MTGEWLLIYQDGIVSTKDEVRFPVFDPGVNTMVTVVVPEYRPGFYAPQNTLLRSGNWNQRTDVIENIERRARDDLRDEMPRHPGRSHGACSEQIYSREVGAGPERSRRSPGKPLRHLRRNRRICAAGNMLPASIQVARLPAVPGVPAEIPGKGFVFPAVPDHGQTDLWQFLFASSIGNRVFSYPAMDYAVPTELEYVEMVVDESANRL